MRDELLASLDRRARRVERSTANGAWGELRNLVAFVRRHGELRMFVETAGEPGDDEGARMRELWGELVGVAADQSRLAAFQRAMRGDGAEGTWRNTVANLLLPFLGFLADRVDEASSVLALLLRYARRVALLDAERLGEAAEAGGEDACRRDLFRFLLDQGVPLALKEAEMGRGRADIFLHDGRLGVPVEVKLNRSPQTAEQVVRDAVRQASAYGMTLRMPGAFAAVFNASPSDLRVCSSSSQGESPVPYVDRGCRVFVVSIDIGPRPRAGDTTAVSVDLDALQLDAGVP